MKADAFMSKKVFFLYPHSVVQQELVQELVANEYAVYLVSDHRKFRMVLPQFEEPIVFINIDENLTDGEWQQYVSDIIEAENNTARVGILTYNEDKELAQTYLMDLGVQCGFIKLKLGLEQSRSIILKTLEANEAKGRRKYLRINCWQHQYTELNVMLNDKFCGGRIKDISSVGMAFVFNEPQVLNKNTMLNDIQLKLRGKISRISGPVIGSRETSDGVIYVMLFKQPVEPQTKARIHYFIYETLQDDIKALLSK